MKTSRILRRSAVTAVGICVAPLLFLGVSAAAQGQDPNEAGVQVLTRGPVHEAFAEASMSGATAGVVITKAPYDPITEMPPDQRPEGGNIAWIPGYWAWDDDRNDFIWVSGVWRDLPPGRQWVPGYWAPVGDGSQWISGFWGDVAQTEVTYLPAPPEPLEVGPSSPSPGPRHQWNSGSWVWQQTRYDWQPGYWVQQQPDWVWSPAHYTWTPRGYIYVPGYWDHDIIHRGVMFAPVYYEQPVYRRPSYYYSPVIVIDLTVIVASLFVQPRSHHYYYGDYYDRRYEQIGYQPWYAAQSNVYGGDPLYAYYRSRQLQHDPDWDLHIAEQYQHRRDHVDARPPQTMALQVNFINNQEAGVPDSFLIGRNFSDAVKSKRLPQRFTSVSMDERKQFETHGREVRKLQVERATMEKAPDAAGRPEKGDGNAQPVKMRLPASPVAARPSDKVEQGSAPPPVPRAPKPVASEGRPEKPQADRNENRVPRPQVKPARVEAKPSPVNERPKRVAPGPEVTNPKPAPQKVEARPSPVNERPKRVESKPAVTHAKPTPKKAAPRPASVQREVGKAKTKPQSRAPQSVEKTTPQKAQAKAKPEATSPKRPQAQSKPEIVAPKRDAAKPEAKASGSTSQKPESKAPQADAKKRQDKQTQTPGTGDTGDNANKKNDKR